MRRLGNAILVCACALIVTTPVFADGPELEPTRSELNWLECVEALVGISITRGFDLPEEPEEPEELSADFKIYQLVYVDPVTGEEQWEEIGPEADDPLVLGPVELGLRVKFDATWSTGNPAVYVWDFGDGTYSIEPVEYHQCSEELDVTLSVYNADYTEFVEITKTVRVDDGVQLLSETPYAGFPFKPVFYTLSGSEVWSISMCGDVAWCDVANPSELPPLSKMPIAPLTSFYGLAHANQRLYVSRGSAGVDVYHADPSDFYLIRRIPPEDLGCACAMEIAAVDDILYVTSGSHHLIALGVEDLEGPVVLSSVDVGHEIRYAAKVCHDAILVHGFGSPAFSIVDVRQPSSPALSLTYELDSGRTVCSPASVHNGLFAISATGGAVMSQLLVPQSDSEPFVLGEVQDLPWGASSAALSRSHAFLRNGETVRKFNVVDPFDEVYLQQVFEVITPVNCTAFTFDPDGPSGPEPAVSFFGYDVGYKAFLP